MPTDTYTGTIAASEQVCNLMRRINALEASVSGGTETLDRSWGTSGSGDSQYDTIRGVHVSGDEVYTTESGNDRVKVTDLNGVYSRKWGSAGSGNGDFSNPEGIFVYSGEVYVVDGGNNRIQVFNTSGTFQRKWGSVGSGDGEFSSPYGIWVDSGEVYVCDAGNNRVQVFNASGVFQRKWGSSGTSDGQFSTPRGISIYNSEVYVADGNNDRVQVFSTAGTFDRKFGTLGSGNGQLDTVTVVYASVTGVYVADFGNSRFQVFTTSGSYLRQFTSTNASAVYVYASEVYTSRGGDLVYVYDQPSGIAQTTFNSYTTTVATSLGTPDGGVSIPSLNGLNANGAGPVPNHILDMRTAIETLAPYFTNAATGNPYNWTASSDNLYFVAMGDRSAYGATGGAAYDWTRNEAAMINTPAYGLDIGEVASCLDQLEAS